MTKIRKIRCHLYNALDWFKTTPLSLPFYGWKQFRHFGPIEVPGTVSKCAHKSIDGDLSFDVTCNGKRWHCEITPCADDALRAQAAALKEGQRVLVGGTRTKDPSHLGMEGGGDEVHPVKWIIAQ